MAIAGETAASLRFRGDDLDPAEITAALGCEPDSGCRKGEYWSSPSGRKNLARTGRWHLSAPREKPGDLDLQITKLLARLTDDLAVWADITTRHHVDLFCGVFLDESNQGVGFTPATMRLLADRGIEVDLDIYGPRTARGRMGRRTARRRSRANREVNCHVTRAFRAQKAEERAVREAEQRRVCARAGADFVEAPDRLKVGIALATMGLKPLNGLRHLPAGDTTGWYIWAGEEMSEDDDFFQPLCVDDLANHVPSVIPYLGLAPGWRFLIAGDYEDVWFDETLLVE